MGIQGQAVIDFGPTPSDSGTFIVGDNGLVGLTFAEVWFMRDSTTENTVDEHETACSVTRICCSLSGAQLTVFVDVLIGYLTGKFNIRYVAN